MNSASNQHVLAAINQRRSIRTYTGEEIPLETLREIVRAGIRAPSGLNNQPWRFVLIRDPEMRRQLAEQTTYRHIVLAAPALIAVFLDRRAMYDEIKDHQAAGACLQNMLLAAEALGLGAVWLGQIRKNKAEVARLLGLGEEMDLAAMVALGRPEGSTPPSPRKAFEEFILKEI